MENQYVVFDIASEDFGVTIASVESIIKMQAITRMPHAPAFVEGVINLRGKVLPVIDLRKRLGMKESAETHDSRIVVIRLGEMQVGMIVDGVSEVLTIQEGCVETAPSITTTVDSSFITGLAKIDDRLIILLDLERVLSTEEQKNLVEAI